ncbi:hypothetical protein FYK55_24910 [Roseiconus nitratireducens]|uniref:FAD-dependent urate hydroxylase HpyO/Asp monooxygenase CreE-like FAD/NAD(P)-binding domain-containing protein n=1 Tax=Roseiconus nitratireducens TaxID=2605748 RepID=A0A5M6CVA8_9BACT|nr:FAD/NAD(P)-binding domain-containing protein [Roseiconus nitratireducens]KAA5539164.1 hypothetical protein FYK55_24910 [Roseiconus nitratireducens]
MSVAPNLGANFLDAPAVLPRRSLRLAIIGCGPRGLHCLESLSRRLSPGDLARLQITIFEPTAFPGAGAVYAPDQPEALKMNFSAGNIDAWGRTRGTGLPDSERPSLIEWLKVHFPRHSDPDAYVPRAIVGQYLHDAYQRVRRQLQSMAIVRHHREKVDQIRNVGGVWEVKTAASWRAFDEVVVATGHEGLRPSCRLSPTQGDGKTNRRGRFVYPVESNLCRDQIVPGGTVVIRGFGLTAIDAILSLTEGRGGRFAGQGLLPNYFPSQLEPRCIRVHSRSGRPMLAKPTRKVAAVDETFYRRYQAEFSNLLDQRGRIHFHRQIWPIIVNAAAGMLVHRGIPRTVREVDQWYRGWSRYRMDSATARRHLFQSVCVAHGTRPIDEAYALGEAWRRLYPQMVEVVSFGGLGVGQFRSFQRVSMEMEKIAFGPPAESVAKLVRLMKLRIVQRAEEAQLDDAGEYVDAVLAGPTEAGISGPIRSLMDQGYVCQDAETGGVRVERDGSPLDAPRGLAVFGRATEGWIVGNDTLSRTLHDQIENWAQTVLSRLHADIV